MSDYEDSYEYMVDEALAGKRKLSAEVKRLRAENERLRAALQPFAHAADVLEAKLSALCKLHNVWVDSAVCKVAQTYGEWGRVKITRPAQLRAFFTVDDERGWLVIRLVLRRAENTYNQAEIVWKAEKRRAA